VSDLISAHGSGADPEARALSAFAREGGSRILIIGAALAREVAALLEAEGRTSLVLEDIDITSRSAPPSDVMSSGRSSGGSPRSVRQLAERTFDVVVLAGNRSTGRMIDSVRNRGMLAPDGFIVAALSSENADDAEVQRSGFSVTRRWPLESGFVARLEPMGEAHELARLRPTVERLEAELADAGVVIERLQAEIRTLNRKLRTIYESRMWRTRAAAARTVRRLPSLRKPRGRKSQEKKPSAPLAPAAGEMSSSSSHVPAPAEKVGFAVDYLVEQNTTMREMYETAFDKKAFETDRIHVAVTVADVDLTDPGRRALAAVGLGRWLDRSGFEVVHLPPERWDEIPSASQILLSMSPDGDPLAAPDGCLRLAWIRDRVKVWANSANLMMSHGVFAASEDIAAQIGMAYPGPIAILRDGFDEDFFGTSARKATRFGALTTVPQRGRERELYASLRAGIDYPLAIFGDQRGRHTSLERFHRGPVGPFDMPGLYEQAELVLEDSEEEAGEGRVLSGRVLEAIASGALVILDSSRFLREAHLDEIPTYISPAGLRSTVHRYLESPQQREELVARLHDVVVREHSWEHRAGEFANFCRSLDGDPAVGKKKVVAFYPHYYRNNPYQRMLYSRLGEHEVSSIPLNDPEQLARSPLLAQRDRAFILHLHWTSPILADSPDEGTAKARMEGFLAALDRLRDGAVKIIWTVHNVLPHESVFPDLEAALCQGIADRADLIHVMCQETPGLVAPHYRLPADRVRVIPHGSYVDAYPNLITQERARDELGLSDSNFVVCCFGGIRRYKGIDRLLEAFEALYEANLESRLLLVGPLGDFENSVELAARCAAHPGILSNFNRVADTDVQIFLNASDVVVLPQQAPLNSGALMLAFSFARPVVAARAGCLEGMVSPDVGLTFDPAKPDDLKRVLMQADRLKTQDYRDAAYRKALAYPYPAMAEDFARIVEELFED
jgi:beta-1,4-mannosyltransferase